MSDAQARGPVVEVLWWSGCPSTQQFVETLRPLLEEVGIDADRLVLREIGTDEEAVAEGFVGSPTLRIGGREVIPPAPGDPPALTCRVYRRRDGRVSPTPDPADVRDALHAAALARACSAEEAAPAPLGEDPWEARRRCP